MVDPLVTFTARAQSRVRAVFGAGPIRMACRPNRSGRDGFRYVVRRARGPPRGLDVVTDVDGLQVRLDPHSFLDLVGLHVDWVPPQFSFVHPGFTRIEAGRVDRRPPEPTTRSASMRTRWSTASSSVVLSPSR